MRALAFVLIFFALSSTSLAGEQRAQVSPHYVFSNYFGSGLYSGSGTDLTIFNLPFTYEPEQEGRNRYRFRLPVSLGFYDFEFDEVTEIEVPKEVGTLTVTGGIEFDHWVTDNLKLVPFIDLGIAQELNEDERALVYASGLSGFYYFEAFGEKHTWLTRMQRAGYDTVDQRHADSFSSFETGVDMILPYRFQAFGRASYNSVFVKGYWYYMNLAFDPESIRPNNENNAQEFGATWGFEKPLDFYLFSLDRIGIGYRRGRNFDLWHITFDLPLD